MAELKVEVAAAEMGFDAARLNRIDRYFARYVDDGRLPGWLILVSRAGKIVHLSTYGWRDLEAGATMEVDTLFRIFSMTKPITSVAAMMLYEEGAFELKDPVSRFIPAFADVRVYRSSSSLKPMTEPATEPVRIWHLLTHTAGLTYGFHYTHPVDALYRGPPASSGGPRRAPIWPPAARPGPVSLYCSSQAPNGIIPWLPMSSAGWWNWLPAGVWISSSLSGSSNRWV